MRSNLTPLTAVFIAMLAAGCGKKQEPAPKTQAAPPPPPVVKAEPGVPTIAVIPKGTTHVFWKSVEAGARKAGEELGVNIRWKGPLKENDRAQQIQLVQQFLAEGVDAIVVAPLDDEALVAPCRAAMAADIPVVIFDSALKGEIGKDYVSFVATDNFEGGKLGGMFMGILLGDTGSVALLRYQIGSASTDKREAGFLDAIGTHADIKVIVENQYAGPTVGEAIQTCENMLDHLKAADGIFAPNESSTVGMLTTLQRHGLAGKVKFIGFDSSPVLVDALKDGSIDGLVVQDPTKMGYLAVKTAVARLRDEAIEERVDTGIKLVTKADLGRPEIAALIGTE